MEKLKFLETLTVNEFKAQKGVSRIHTQVSASLSMAVKLVQSVTSSSMERLPILLSPKYAHLIQVICSICYIKEVKVEL